MRGDSRSHWQNGANTTGIKSYMRETFGTLWGGPWSCGGDMSGPEKGIVTGVVSSLKEEQHRSDTHVPSLEVAFQGAGE